MLNKKKNFYQHRFSQKQLINSKFNFSTNFFTSFFYCVSLGNSHTNFLGIYKNFLGIYKILPLIDCIRLGDKINFYKNIIKFMYFMYVGSIMWLKYYDVFFLISNVGTLHPKYALSNGTYVLILKKTFKKTLIRLPSFQRKWISNFNYGMLGRNCGVFKKKEYLGKASVYISNKSIKVRSTAKNPVDHPNGGRTRGKMVFKTPWGLIAKNSK